MAETLIEGLEKRRSFLTQQRRSEWDAEYKDCRKYISWERGRFEGDRPGQKPKRDAGIIDTTARRALATLVAGLSSGLTSPARPWFRLTTPDDDLMEFAPAKEWLHQTEKRMRKVFQTSNVYNALPQGYGEIGQFGTIAAFWLRSFQRVIRGDVLTAGEYAMALDDEGNTDTLVRSYHVTIEQAARSFGLEALPATFRGMYDRGDRYKFMNVHHFVSPREKRERGKIDAANLSYQSVYWAHGEHEPLRVSGFADRPFTGARWEVTASQTYGHSPGMVALGDAKQIQLQERRKAQLIDKIVTPPMQGPTALRNSNVSMAAGGITYVDGFNGNGPVLRPAYEVNPNALPALASDMAETRQRIDQAFFKDLFLMISETDTVRTATEIAIRQEEKMLMLGPVLERIHSELLNPLIDRAFNIMMDVGLLPPPPPELEGMDLRVDYISVLAQAQKAVTTGSVERLTGFVGNLAGVDPSVLDKLDVDQAVDEYSDMLGVPPSLVRSDDLVAEIRANRRIQEQSAAALAAGKEAAETAKVLSQADTRPGNALSAIVGGQ
jgi:hypothetical protein